MVQRTTLDEDCWSAEEALRSTKSAMDQAERSYCERLAGVHATSFFVYSGILRRSLLNGCTETVHERIAELEIRSMAAQSAWVIAERAKAHESSDGSISQLRDHCFLVWLSNALPGCGRIFAKFSVNDYGDLRGIFQ
jgi:hypothetical protein